MTNREAATRIGDYRLVRELGRGGMGVVHEAWQESLGRAVALKILAPHLTHDPSTLVRFRREASTAARLEHPGIAQVLEFGASGEQQFLAMQLVRGSSLESILKDLRARPLSESDGESIRRAIEQHDEASNSGTTTGSSDADAWTGSYVQTVIRIILQVAETLDYAHGEGVIHRDVKPSNILVQRNGRPVLVDFGLARAEGPSSLTVTGDFAGSPYYVSPEQASRVSSELDRRTDVFSLGTTLYEALTFRRPFEGANPHEVIDRILHAEPDPPNKWNANLSADLAAVVLKAIEKPTHRRYQSAGEFAQDLRAVLDSRPVTAHYPSTLERLARWTRREPMKAGVLAAMIAAIVLTAYVLATRGERLAGERALREQRINQTLADGWFSTQNEDPGLANSRFAEALALDPGNPRALFGYAWTMREPPGETPATAEEKIQLAVELNKRRVAFLDAQAIPGRGDRAVAKMRRHFERFSERVPKPRSSGSDSERTEGDVLVLFAEALFRLPSRRSKSADQAFRESLSMLDSVIYQSAVPRFEHFFMMASIATEVRDERRARLCSDALLTHWPDFAPAVLAAGDALRFADPERAFELVQRAVELRPTLFSAQLRLASMSAARDRMESALAAAERAAQLRPDKAEPHNYQSVFRSRMALRLDDSENADRKRNLLERAVTDARRSVDLEPDNVPCLMQLAATEERAGDVRRAFAALGRVVTLAPRHVEAHRNLIRTARSLDDLAAQRREHERWASANPRNATAQREWADFLMEHGSDADQTEAFRAARAAFSLVRYRDPFVVLTLVDALLREGDREDVDRLLDRAAAVKISDPKIRAARDARVRELRRRD